MTQFGPTNYGKGAELPTRALAAAAQAHDPWATVKTEQGADGGWRVLVAWSK